jgi:hypothetical protein
VSRAQVAGASQTRRTAPRVHGAWTRRWWEGETALAALLGPPPAEASLDAAAARIDAARVPDDWRSLLDPAGEPVPRGALVVLAGQQPVLAGGPALVAHKAATAVRLARLLARRWSRPVVPVYLLATDDHDGAEVDHVDHVAGAAGALTRTRCRVQPGADCFHRSRWDEASLPEALCDVAGLGRPASDPAAGSLLRAALQGPAERGFAAHVGNLLLAAFGSAGPGLRLVQAHHLSARASALLARALREAPALQRTLAEGAPRAAAARLPESFDPADARPLVMESRDGRRRRLPARAPGALGRLARTPADFSPHAALRPIVQAALLPVVAQVCGPSELAYLGQARGLHAHFGVEAPVLVPRLEATRVPAADLVEAGVGLDAFVLDDADQPPVADDGALDAALDHFAASVGAADPSLRARAERLAARTRRDARRLLDALAWHGRTPPGRREHLSPRGRPQDTVLAWLPDAWAHGDPAAWGRRITDLARPLDPPAHVLHVAPPGEP